MTLEVLKAARDRHKKREGIIAALVKAETMEDFKMLKEEAKAIAKP